MVAEGDRLGRLEMGEARHHGAGEGGGAVGQHGLEGVHLLVELVDRIPDPEAEVDRHLVVARAGGVQATGVWPDDLGQARLDIHMDVLEGARERESAGLDFLLDLV